MKKEERDVRLLLGMSEGAPKFLRLSVKKDGEEVAFAELDEFRDPFRFFYISRVEVLPEHQGSGYASKMMDKIEGYIKRKKAPGILIDTIERDSRAYGMYLKRRWKPFMVPGGQGVYVFNRGFRSDKKLAEAFQACSG